MTAEVEIRNATITDTFLGIEDHGLFIFTLFMDYGDGVEQGYQLILASKAEAKSVNILRDLLLTVGVDTWERLKGKNVRCVREDGMIRGVGHITVDKWFRPDGKNLADSLPYGD